MNNGSNWLLIKHTLGQASVVLEELLKVLQWNSVPQESKDNLSQAQQGIISSLQDEKILQQASEIINYQELVKKLEASENNITPEVIDRARQL
jgi:hypothetical protein